MPALSVSLLTCLLVATADAVEWVPAVTQEQAISEMARVASAAGGAQASAQLPMRLAELVTASPVVMIAKATIADGVATRIEVVEVLGLAHPAIEDGARPDLPAGTLVPCRFAMPQNQNGRQAILFGGIVAPDGEARFLPTELKADQDLPASPSFAFDCDTNGRLLVRRLCLLRDAGVGIRYPHELAIPAHAAFPLLKTAWDERMLVSYLPLMDDSARTGPQAPRPFGLGDVILAARHAIERSSVDPWLAPVGIRILAGAATFTTTEESLALMQWVVSRVERTEQPRLRGMLSALALQVCRCNATAPNASSLFAQLETLSALLLAGPPSPMDLPVSQAAAAMAARFAAPNRERIRANADLLAAQVAARAAGKP